MRPSPAGSKFLEAVTDISPSDSSSLSSGDDVVCPAPLLLAVHRTDCFALTLASSVQAGRISSLL